MLRIAGILSGAVVLALRAAPVSAQDKAPLAIFALTAHAMTGEDYDTQRIDIRRLRAKIDARLDPW
jgi:hypothetical protein